MRLVLTTLFIILTSFVFGQSYLQQVGIRDSLYSETLKEYREIFVQLPANLQKGQHYPVVYILDGEVLLPTVHNVQSFYSGGFTPEMVLIGISNAKNRTRDLTTSKITEKYGFPFQEENGEAGAFRAFIESELIPYVEGHYPVTNFRTLIGHSYGGLFTVHLLLNHPGLFSNYVAIDPSLDWDDQKILKNAAEKLSSNDYKGKSLFLSLGGQLHMQNPEVTIDNVMNDSSEFTLFARSNLAFSTLVETHGKGLAYEWAYYPEDLHGTIAFPSIKDGLLFDFKWFQMENTDKFNSPETSSEELASIITYRANKLREYFSYDVPPYPQELLNVLGYMSMDMDQMDKARMYFENLIRYYPNAANAYDSMADYYERTGDYTLALKFVTRAYELSGDDYHRDRIEELKTRK